MRAILVAACMAAVGCSAGENVGSAEDSELVSDTVVVLRGDGAPTVTTLAITRAERLRQMAERAERQNAAASGAIGVREEAISQDTTCAGTSLWLYNAHVANQGTASRICFSGAGTAYMVNFALGTGNWDHQVKSYWPGNDSGQVEDNGGLCVFTFGVWGANSDVSNLCDTDIDNASLN